ncbi:hypothetical protein MNBD_GAMMA12-1035 [hydrothermal vent metagenome]|uniref:Uncharacterized protein n=1 Tax=hydrothermal vent metagenome TaxID=652676 RepID=A0A3B0YMR9_9ZZZZ
MKSILSIQQIAIFVIGVSVVTMPAYAVNVQTGQNYTGRVKLVFPNAGVSFVLPAGWKGGVPKGKDVFVLGSNGLSAIGVIGIKKQKASVILQEMRRPIPFLAKTQLMLVGSVKRKGNTLFGLYRVQGSQDPMGAYVISVFANNGNVVAFLVAARLAKVNRMSKDLQSMIASLTLPQTKKSRPSNVTDQGNNASNSQLGRMLSGLKLTYMKTGSTTRTKINIVLCKNGSFYKTENYGGVSGGGTIAGRNANRGRWTMAGTQGFVLHYNNGKVINKRVTFQGGKLYLNGVLYFKNGSAGC